MTLVQLVTAPGQWLRADAAASWDRVAREVQRRYGWLPVLTDSARPIAVQERIFLDRYDAQKTGGGYHNDVRTWRGVRYVRRRYRKSDGAPAAAAAVPGTSRHGPGLAVDASGLGGFTGTRYRQLMSVQAEYGWSNAAGRTINEAWHQEYDPDEDQHLTAGGGGSAAARPTSPTSEEDTMSAAGEARIIELLEGITIDARDSVREGRARDKKIDGVVIDARDSALGARRLPGITIDARDGVLGNRQILAEVAGLRVAVAALASKAGLDPKAITAAVDAGVTSALGRVETTVTVKPEAGK